MTLPRVRPAAFFFTVLAVALFAGFIALGTWQVERRAWKLDLIERVNARVNAAPVAAPVPAQWSKISAANDEYRHVLLSGTFLHDRETLVQAVTRQGSGFWVLTPLRAADGSSTVLVNRGFVPADAREHSARATNEPVGNVTVTGLLRLTEPGGGFLRRNDAAGDRWFSRDVEAIAAARGLANVAPYFVDADANPAQPLPVGGLTVIAFHNSHLVYAITWYGLALMVVGAAWLVRRESLRRRIGENRRDVQDD
ncbi:MAG: SURF1 family protein [Variovorax sp.]|nr:MAG: SURF1 family protein [Variovorax sp.]